MMEVKQAVKRLLAGAMALSLTGMCTISAFAANEADLVLEDVFGTSNYDEIVQNTVLDILDVDAEDVIGEDTQPAGEVGAEAEVLAEAEASAAPGGNVSGDAEAGETALIEEEATNQPTASAGEEPSAVSEESSDAEEEEGEEEKEEETTPVPDDSGITYEGELYSGLYRENEDDLLYLVKDGEKTLYSGRTIAESEDYETYLCGSELFDEWDDLYYFKGEPYTGLFRFSPTGYLWYVKDGNVKGTAFSGQATSSYTYICNYVEQDPDDLFYYEGGRYTGLFRFSETGYLWYIKSGKGGTKFTGQATSSYTYICNYVKIPTDSLYYYNGCRYTGLFRFSETGYLWYVKSGKGGTKFTGQAVPSSYAYICNYKKKSPDNLYYYNGCRYTGLFRFSPTGYLWQIKSGQGGTKFSGQMTSAYTYICNYVKTDVDNCYYENGVKATVKKPATLSYSSSYKSSKYYRALMALKLVGSARSNILKIALSQLGYHEGKNSSQLGGNGTGSGNYTEYGRYYGLTYGAWCAMFVSWCARENRVSTKVIPKYAAVRDYYSFYHRSGQKFYSWKTVRTKGYQPQAGDLIMYANVKGGTAHHIGYVISSSYSSSKVILTTVEGNTSDEVRKVVMNMSRSSTTGYVNSHYILGVAHPNY